MLKITNISEDNESVTLRLDGKLSGVSVGELEEVCSRYRSEEKKAIVLDLSGVNFIDRSGLEMLERFKDDQIKLINGSLFIEALVSGLKK